MDSRQRVRDVTYLSRLARGRRLDRNPLRRASDRAETVTLILLLLVFLAGAPLAALASGAWAHAAAQRTELAQSASRRQVTAVILAVPADSKVGYWDPAAITQSRWTAPDGTVVTGELPASVGTRAGTTLRVWTTWTGQLVSHPLSDSQVASLTLLGQATGAAAVTLVLALAGLLTRLSLSRRRMAAWDADWQATGPRWTTRA